MIHPPSFELVVFSALFLGLLLALALYRLAELRPRPLHGYRRRKLLRRLRDAIGGGR